MDGNFASTIADAVADAAKQMGHVNILIAGRSGVGKSTLVNAIFHEDLAETGQGRPVTKETKEITKEGMPVSIFDTRGLEMADYKSTIGALTNFIQARKNEVDPTKHIHVAWICVMEDGRRVEPAEVELHAALSKVVPVIGVITKHRSDQGFKKEVEGLLPECRNVVQVRAIKEELEDDVVLQPKGLSTLVEVTIGAIPEGAKRAFASAQKADLNTKKSEARKIIMAAATASGAAGVSPIPFSDAMIIAPVQIGMIAKITSIFGVNLTNSMLTSLVSSAVGVAGASFLGRTLVSNLIKFIPGVGTAAGAAISGTTAVALTSALGEAYLAAMVAIFTDDPDASPTGEEIGTRFKNAMRDMLKK
ncbi:uncharacterized protein (DUF697 family)/GTPase Era involved in 16S rRNA processing [Stenotrophomonas sp. PvP093]|uniref:YcjF family protein n=1 Tax=unclassified Stenotrophomonas TaxID=196198 RepID=UPI001AE6AAB9|nr:DUF697 domain-containing protein [Stenotrophomonas sp. PvP093]MBP2483408.1 uncharacterized protein (DUF697 family)/GTPase Era involved in 16S rRNA processing [Stenotrophomonas sp. PvP093]